MYSDLPPHLQTLNAIPSSSSPPSSALTAEQEDAFWSFLNTDELFHNFGVAPSAFEAKQEKAAAVVSPSAPASTPAADEDKEDKPTATTPATLESFLATFASEAAAQGVTLPQTSLPPQFLLGIAPNAYEAATAVHSPAAEPETPSADASTPGRITGAKRLKQLGAGQAEIEEDKRRRNTEASARFRQKKKQREQALEGRAKELEAQVAKLSSEKGSLEKENQLLKFVLLNTQGAGASDAGLSAAIAALGKRKRDE